jgi:very-short-patch-repair endonuclease
MVKYKRPPLATTRARHMRREMTDAERKLWLPLRDRRLSGAKFRRQAPVGPYIADFVCLSRKFIVEADGGQHSESAYDAERDGWLKAEGYIVVRYSNLDILKNPRGVLEDIFSRLQSPAPPSPGLGSLRSPRPPSPPEGRG